MKKILIHCAMEKEGAQLAEKLGLNKVSDNVFNKENVSLLISGIGKEMTAIALTEYLCKYEKPDLIINVGYAGSTNVEIGTWVSINKSYNLEWNIPGEEKYSMPIGNQDLKTIDSLKNLPCYSAECFVESTDIKDEAIFDMELHAACIICDMKKIDLMSLKKVSDNLSFDKYHESLSKDEIFEIVSSLKYIEEVIQG